MKWSGRVASRWVVTGPERVGWNRAKRSHPLKVQGTQAQSGGGTLCNTDKRRRGGGRSRQEREADRGKLGVNAGALSLVSRGADWAAAAEGCLVAARGRAPREGGPGAMRGEVDGEDGQLPRDVGIEVAVLSPDTVVAGGVRDHGRPKQLVPEWS